MVSLTPGSDPEKRLGAMARILKLLRETDDFEQLVTAFLDNLKEELDYTLLWMGMYDRTQQSIVCQGYVSPQPHRLLKRDFVLTPGDLIEQVVVHQRPLRVNDLREEARIGAWHELANDLNIQGTLLFPIRRREVCYGVLVLGSSQWGQSLSVSDRSFISTVSGALADVFYQREQAQGELQQDSSHSIFTLIQQLDSFTEGDDQLEAVANGLLQFIRPDRVRIFGFNPTQSEFWERLTLQAKKTGGHKRSTSSKPGIAMSASDIRGVYQVLQGGQLLIVGESGSLTSVPDRFMQLLDAQALMVAPFFQAQTLMGFISVEYTTPQIWSEAQREYLTTVSKLVGFLAPGNAIEAVRQQADADQQLLTGIVRSIQTDTDWRTTLETCSTTICQRFGTEQFVVLAYDVERGSYDVVFQRQSSPRKGQALDWKPLDSVDWQMLERNEEAIAINDLANNLKLLAWRDNFEVMQAQAVLACNVSPGNAPEGIVLVASQAPRHWVPEEGQLLQKVARQIGLILHQWQLQRQTTQQEDLYDSIQWGLQTLQQTVELDKLEESACQYLMQLLHPSMVVLVTWQTGQAQAYASRILSRRKDFGAEARANIDVGSDAVINWALQTDGPLSVNWEDLPEATRQWVIGPSGSKFLLVALRTAEEYAPNGVWLLADRADRKWTDYNLSLIALLANQLAWSRRHLSLIDTLSHQREFLQTLNWYKHRRLDEVHRRLELDLQRLSDPITQNNGLTAQRQLQLVRQLTSLTESIKVVLDQEEWHLQHQQRTSPLISLVNRLMERANPLIKARQLWAKVHNDSNVIIWGDLEKIEFVLFELMAAACKRSPDSGRLDIWCRPLDRSCLELSITDDGSLPNQLLTELAEGRSEDALVPSLLNTPPGLHFSICQTLMQQTGGEFTLQKLKDGRIMSRVVLAISGKGRLDNPTDAIATSKTSSKVDS